MALIENIISSSIERKHIIRDKPLIGDISRINKCFVEYVGTPTPLSNVSVTMWMCSWSYTKLNNTVTTDTREIISDSGAIRKVFNYPGGTTSAKDIRVFTIELGDLSSGIMGKT